MKPMTEQENLELQIKTYDSNYRAGTPLATDQAYDQLIEELKSKFPNSELLKKGVITQKVSRKEALPLPMFSLNKAKSLAEIKQWLKSNDISGDELLVITPKYDGISLVVNELYKNTWTRGDGEYGQNSKEHFLKLRCNMSLVMPIYSFGEAIMPKVNFQKYKDKFANPRNMVAGLFNRDEPVEELRDVDYIRYGSDQENDKKLQLEQLNLLNTTKVQFYVCDLNWLTEDKLNALYNDWSQDYQIDGLVIDINSSLLRKKLGREENNNPKYARAYKNPEWSGSAVVKVLGITWQVSKQGKLKPVIQIEPTEVDGVVISNVTGINAKYVLENNIAEGSIINIIRSGQVIPKHVGTFSWTKTQSERLDSDEFQRCPSCESLTEWDETHTELICNNPDCEEKRIMKLVHFFNTLEFEEFGEPSVRKIWNAGYRRLSSILTLSKLELQSIDGFGNSSSDSLLKQITKLREVGVPLAQYLDSLDLFDGKLGTKTIQLILDNLWPDSKFDVASLIKIDGIGESSATTFLKGWRESDKYAELPILISYIQTPKKEVVGDKFKDQRICFTGCRPTKEMESEIQSQGGEVVSGVSSKTTILVVKNLGEMNSSKAVKAKQLGIKIIEFSKL